MKTCYILIGPPGVGKSTWVKNNIDRMIGDSLVDVHVASSDEIIEEVAEIYGMTYDQAFKNLINFADQAMMYNLNIAIEDECDIVIDRTNMSRKSRQRFIGLIKKHGYKMIAVVFQNPDKAEWNRRLASRPNKTIPQHVIENMMESFQFPMTDEGFDEIQVVQYD